MWREIFVDDIEALQKHVDIFNAMKCNIDNNITVNLNLIKRILNTKNECHCYYYKDIDREIIVLYKYDPEYDRMILFQHFDNILFSRMIKLPIDKTMDIYREKIRIILERYGKIVRVSKMPDSVIDHPEFIKIWGSRTEWAQLIIDNYAEGGIKAVELENYWEYELM